MSNVIATDLCVIGAGSGGLAVAAGAVQMGAEVVLIEKGKMGGDCLNYGCVPSKSLIAAGKAAYGMRSAAKFGIEPVEPTVDFGRVHDHVHGVIAAIAPHDSVERFEALGVRVIKAAAQFTGPREVEAGGQCIRAKRFVIATGSSPLVPPIDGIDETPYFTNETIFDNTERPDHLIIIGGGPIGLEMAQAHRRLGSRVTVLEMAGFFAKDDPETAHIALESVRADGVELLDRAEVRSVRKAPSGIAVGVEKDGRPREIEGSHLLVAVGRAANVDGLDLQAAGVDYDRKGIKVDKRLRTTNKKIFAIGDVTGGMQFTHVAGYQAGIVIRNALFRLPAKGRTDATPWVTYVDPELAQVGLTEAQAREEYGDKISVLRWDFAENDRAQAERATDGLLKVITRKDKVLGASMVGKNAGELIQPWIVAIEGGVKIGKMAAYIAPYPTMGEANKRAAGQYYTDFLFGPKVRKLVRLLLRLG